MDLTPGDKANLVKEQKFQGEARGEEGLDPSCHKWPWSGASAWAPVGTLQASGAQKSYTAGEMVIPLAERTIRWDQILETVFHF